MTIAVLIFVGWFAVLVFTWSLCEVAGRADDRMEQYEQDHRSIDR